MLPAGIRLRPALLRLCRRAAAGGSCQPKAKAEVKVTCPTLAPSFSGIGMVGRNGVVTADDDRKRHDIRGGRSQSPGGSWLGGRAETVECQPRLFTAGANAKRSLCIGRSQIALAQPLVELGTVDQRGIAAVCTQRNRLCQISHRAFPVRSPYEGIGALAVDGGQDVGSRGTAVIRREGLNQHRIVCIGFDERGTIRNLQVKLLFGFVNRTAAATRIE